MATSPYNWNSPRSVCKHCGCRIIKLREYYDDSWWRHEHNDTARCPSGKEGVILDTFASPNPPTKEKSE